MTRPVETHVLWLRLAQARADCALWRAAGDPARLQDALFVAATLVLRIGARLHGGTPAACAVLQPPPPAGASSSRSSRPCQPQPGRRQA